MVDADLQQATSGQQKCVEGLRRQALSSDAMLAKASVSFGELPIGQLPPTHRTGSNASYSGALKGVLPPVGQNLGS